MKKFLHGMVQRTCGRDIVRFEFADQVRTVWDAANDAVFEMRRVCHAQ